MAILLYDFINLGTDLGSISIKIAHIMPYVNALYCIPSS